MLLYWIDLFDVMITLQIFAATCLLAVAEPPGCPGFVVERPRPIDCEWRLNNDDANNFHDRFMSAVK